MILVQYPHHRYHLEFLNQFFYNGLTQTCQTIVDNVVDGARGENTTYETYELYEMLGANSQQKSVREKKIIFVNFYDFLETCPVFFSYTFYVFVCIFDFLDHQILKRIIP